MFHALIQAYADAMYVATTLRPPVSAASARESERFADCQERSRARSSGRLAGRIVGWLRTSTAIPWNDSYRRRSWHCRPRFFSCHAGESRHP
jgi:hypothetical protein